jgi:hypothetical protein
MRCQLEVEALFTIDTMNHAPAQLAGFICPINHVRITRKMIVPKECIHARTQGNDEKEWCVDCGRIITTFVEEYPEGFFD